MVPIRIQAPAVANVNLWYHRMPHILRAVQGMVSKWWMPESPSYACHLVSHMPFYKCVALAEHNRASRLDRIPMLHSGFLRRYLLYSYSITAIRAARFKATR